MVCANHANESLYVLCNLQISYICKSNGQNYQVIASIVEINKSPTHYLLELIGYRKNLTNGKDE